MLNFEKYFLNESMNLQVVDHSYDNYPDDVLSVIHGPVWNAINKSEWWRNKKLDAALKAAEEADNEGEIEKVKELLARWYEQRRKWLNPHIIGPDGYDFDKKQGIINFYPDMSYIGKQDDYIEQFLGLIRQSIERFDIPTHVTGPEQSGDRDSRVYRIHIDIPDRVKDDPPEVQMSQRNAYEVFHNVLDVKTEEPVDARDLVFRIDAIINDIDVRAGVVEPQSGKTEGGAQFYDQGIDEDYIRNRVIQVRAVAQWALDNDYSKVIMI